MSITPTPTEGEREARLEYAIERLERQPRVRTVVGDVARKFNVSRRTAQRDVDAAFARLQADRAPATKVDRERTEASLERIAELALEDRRRAIRIAKTAEDDSTKAYSVLVAGRALNVAAAATTSLGRVRGLINTGRAQDEPNRPTITMGMTLEETRARLDALYVKGYARLAPDDFEASIVNLRAAVAAEREKRAQAEAVAERDASGGLDD